MGGDPTPPVLPDSGAQPAGKIAPPGVRFETVEAIAGRSRRTGVFKNAVFGGRHEDIVGWWLERVYGAENVVDQVHFLAYNDTGKAWTHHKVVVDYVVRDPATGKLAYWDGKTTPRAHRPYGQGEKYELLEKNGGEVRSGPGRSRKPLPDWLRSGQRVPPGKVTFVYESHPEEIRKLKEALRGTLDRGFPDIPPPEAVDRGHLPAGGHAPAGGAVKPKLPTARVVQRTPGGALRAAAARFKARSIVIGVRGWRAVRFIGAVALTLFVPLKALDFVFEIALALWDREREKEERKRRQKQRALAEVFKQKEAAIEKLVNDKVLGAASQQKLLSDWDGKKNYPGFLYARVTAVLEIELFRDAYRYVELENLTTYKVVGIDVGPTNWAFDFELTDMGDEKEVPQTEDDVMRLVRNGAMYPSLLRKFVARKRLRYTIVPPLITPFDIVVTKINNLFLDMVFFVAQLDEYGQAMLDSFRGFHHKGSYQDLFAMKLEFPAPLNARTCDYCLSYLHWAAKLLSEHPLTQQDLQGNLEDPVKGWKRRVGLLRNVVDGLGTKYGRNFSFLAGRILNALVAKDEGDRDVLSGVGELYTGAMAIWEDLLRIEREVGQAEYFYYGPSYKPPRR